MKEWSNMTQSLPESIQNYLDNGMSKHGWMTPEKGAALAMHVLEHKPHIAVEIGVYSGRSLIAIALAMEENEKGLVFGIDPWSVDASVTGFGNEDPNNQWWGALNHNEIYQDCLIGIRRHDLEHRTQLIRQTSEQAFMSRDWIDDERIDLLHIDGNHSVESALFDVTNWGQLVRSGGYIWMDDCDWNTTKPAQERLAEIAILDYMVGTCGVYMKI